MCTFENEHQVLVCDVASARVREATSRVFGDAVQVTPIPGQGTRVEVPEDLHVFGEVTREARAMAQQQEAPPAEVDRMSRTQERAR